MYAFDSTTTDSNAARSDGLLRDVNSWYHIFYSRSNGGTDGTLYINGVEQSKKNSSATSTDWFAYEGQIGYRKNGTTRYYDGFMSQLYVIDGQQLSPSDFGFTDPLTNTWKPKKYEGTFGTHGFYLPMDGNSPIGQDKSGNENDWTPVNFGGTVELDSPLVTGTRPILNVTQGGSQAGVGVFGSKQNVGYAVTVYNDGGGNKYYIDGVKQATLTGLIRGATYTFDTSDSSNSAHPFRFSESDGGSEYTNGVAAITGTATTITIPYNSSNDLYYYCTNHSGMGSSITGITTNEKLADQYASNCTLAFAGIGNTTPVDVSASIACTTSTKTLGINGTPTYEVSNFYGPSPRLVGNSSWFTLATTDDVEMGTGDYTLETYAYVHSFPVQYYYIFCTAGSNTSGFAVWGLENNGQIRVSYYNGSTRPNVESVAGTVTPGRWYHFAFSRTSGTQHIFVDGVCVARGTWSEDVSSSPDIRWGTNPASPSTEYGDVSLSDFRIYKGVGKYTASAVGEQAFVVPSAVPDILPDSPSGVSGGSKLTKITEGAINFDGDGVYLEAGAVDTAFGSSSDWTLELFVNARVLGLSAITDPRTSDSSNHPLIWMGGAPGSKTTGVLYYYAGGADRIVGTTVLETGRWYHVAVVRSSGTTTLYLDGKSEGSFSDSLDYASTTNFRIGQRYTGTAYNFNGLISNLRVVNGTAVYTGPRITPPTEPLTNVTNTKLLTCQENQFKILTDTTDATGGNSIQNTNNSGITSTTGNRTDSNSSSLVLAVPFNGTTDDICDEIGSATAKDATLTNSPSSENIGHFYGKSYKFTGANGQRINYAASADFNFGTGAFTVEGWYYHLEKTSSNVARRYFVHNETAWESSRWIIYCGYTGNPNRATFYTYDTYNANGNNLFLIGKTIFAVGNWYHIAVTRSSNTFRLFVNGRLEDQFDDSNSVGNSTIDIEVGGASQQTDRTLFGHIQDLRIYKGVAKYTAPFVPPRVPTYDSAVTPSSNIIGLAGGESLPNNFNPFITDVHTVRGQESGYATLNPLVGSAGLTNVTLSNGNLTFANSDTSYRRYVPSNISMPLNTGKYYFEGVYTKSPDSNNAIYDSFGLIDTSKVGIGTFGPSNVTGIWVYRRNGYKNNQDAGNNDPGEIFGDSWGALEM